MFVVVVAVVSVIGKRKRDNGAGQVVHWTTFCVFRS
jgi:hypothetical protein